jgi:hypothetical protein
LLDRVIETRGARSFLDSNSVSFSAVGAPLRVAPPYPGNIALDSVP